MTDQTDVMETLETYARTYCAKDLDGLMAVFVDSEDISLIGTGADELCSGRAAVAAVFQRNFDEATATAFEWTWTDIAIHGPAAAVAASLNIHLMLDGEKLVVPVRWTVSLVMTTDGWKWIHRHASAAAGSQKDGAAYPTGD